MITKHVRRKGATHLDYVDSDHEPDKEYEIAKLIDGSLACACLGWAFSSAPKTCRHLKAYGIQIATEKAVAKLMPREALIAPPVRSLSYEGKTFRFRRAIALDDALV